MQHKENKSYVKNITDQAYSGLRTDNHSLICCRKMGSQDINCLESPGTRSLPALPRIFLTLEKELYFILNTLGTQAKFPIPRPQVVIGSAKYVHEIEKELCHSLYMSSSWKYLMHKGNLPYNSLFSLSLSLSHCFIY